ncbi:hypothetical protein DFH29DRAFT_874946 [Suillus ampliporus]|nr:hypothetical protein DFH29DRAFT_874946 [Suillus ampliporus]
MVSISAYCNAIPPQRHKVTLQASLSSSGVAAPSPVRSRASYLVPAAPPFPRFGQVFFSLGTLRSPARICQDQISLTLATPKPENKLFREEVLEEHAIHKLVVDTMKYILIFQPLLENYAHNTFRHPPVPHDLQSRVREIQQYLRNYPPVVSLRHFDPSTYGKTTVEVARKMASGHLCWDCQAVVTIVVNVVLEELLGPEPSGTPIEDPGTQYQPGAPRRQTPNTTNQFTTFHPTTLKLTPI